MRQLFRSVSALILREMSTTSGRSPGGYAWAVLEPVAGTALLAFVFSLAFHNPPLGSNFPLFYATGLLPFMMYTDLVTKVSQSISFSRQLLFYPKVTFLDAVIARFTLNLMTQLMVCAIVFVGIVRMFDLNPIINMSAIVSGLSMTAAVGLGIGMLNCYLVSASMTWLRVWAILNRPMFIISCIFFIPESLPEPDQTILTYNPLVHVIGEVRRGFYPSYEGAYISHSYVYGFSAICFTFGLVFLLRYSREILNR